MNLAWSGATLTTGSTGIVTQAASIPTNTDIVLMTGGGNDVGFAQAIVDFYLRGIDPSGWQNAVHEIKSKIGGLNSRYMNVFRAVEKRLGPNATARIVLVGYPNLFVDGLGGENDEVNRLQDLIEDAQLNAARQWNKAGHKIKVTFIPVDGVKGGGDADGIYYGHEVNPSILGGNPYAWINDFLQTAGERRADGTTDSKASFTAVENWMHPNRIGHDETGKLLRRRIIPGGSGVSVRSSAVADPADHGYDVSLPWPAPGAEDEALSAWLTGTQVATPDSAMSFDARGTASGSEPILEYRWDFDSDGVIDETTNEPELIHAYAEEFTGLATVTVEDNAGRTSSASLEVFVTKDGDVVPDHRDNCPLVANYDQEDEDMDGIGNACDPDYQPPTRTSFGRMK